MEGIKVVIADVRAIHGPESDVYAHSASIDLVKEVGSVKHNEKASANDV